jgi:NAD(P)-dependent dehydrogenase (short-subunit alcohol dehydrogenase family)
MQRLINREAMKMARVALVTGGTRGIGAAISRALQQAGRTVVASYAGNDEAASAFSAQTGIKAMKFDAGDYEACAGAVTTITAEIGPIEILVNNAGITRDTTLGRMTRDMWDAVMDTNLGSCFNLCKLTFEGMRQAKFGRIVNIGSINGQAGQYGQVNYAAAKSGIHGFTKALAQEGARGAAGRVAEDHRPHPRRPAGPGRGYRARRGVPDRRRGRFRHRLHHVDQWRPAHVLTAVPDVVVSIS